MYTPPGAKRGHSDWNVSNCILPTWLPSSMTISMGGTDSTSSSQNSGSSWLPIQIDVLWSSSSPGNQQKNNAKRTSGHVLWHTQFRIDEIDDLQFGSITCKKCTPKCCLSYQRKGSNPHQWHGDAAQNTPRNRKGISRNVTDNDKLFWRRQSSSAVSITSIYEVMKKCWKVQGWSSNIQPKSEKNKAFNQKKSLGCVVTHQIHQKLMLTKSMVPLGFPLIFSGRIPTCGSPGSHGDSKNEVNEPWIQVFDRKWRHVVEILMKLDIAMIFRWSTSAPAFHICKEPPLATPISSKCAFLPRKCCKCLW